MRRREESFGLIPGEFEDAGDQQEQKEEECRALAHHQGKNVSDCQRKRRKAEWGWRSKRKRAREEEDGGEKENEEGEVGPTATESRRLEEDEEEDEGEIRGDNEPL